MVERKRMAKLLMRSLKANREGGYSTNFYPFYDLEYYSNGRGKILGLIKKFQAKDDELLEKLLPS